MRPEPIEHSGRVVDEHGAPVPSAYVVVVSGSVPMPEIALLTDDAGRFSLRLPAGTFTLRAQAAAGTGETEVVSASAPGEIVIVTKR